MTRCEIRDPYDDEVLDTAMLSDQTDQITENRAPTEMCKALLLHERSRDDDAIGDRDEVMVTYTGETEI